MCPVSTENSNIVSFKTLVTPNQIQKKLPLTNRVTETVLAARSSISAILAGEDKRKLLVVGPCSIHDPVSSLEYAKKLKKLSEEVSDTMLVVMRVYFEKPRTTIGWKGYINDPHLDGSFHIEEGITKSREFLLSINELGIPAATEALDPVMPQYLGDLIAWTAIGARTTESQTHREMSSGISSPVGFKNGTDGLFETAINGIMSASLSHCFLGIDKDGHVSVVRTKGNKKGHLILRGGSNGSNYDAVTIKMAEEALRKVNLRPNIMVDCSHANSAKDPRRQPDVIKACLEQMKNGNQSIIGFMLESFLLEGNQSIPTDLSQLTYGRSVTDACMDWASTEEVIRDAHSVLKNL